MATSQLNGVICNLRRAALRQDGGGLTDGQLLECFITRRDEAAFEALVRRLGPMILGLCRRLLRHSQDAEDAFQATFLVLARKASAIGQRELVGNWLYGTAYRAALEVKAARRRVKERQVGAMPDPAVIDESEVWRDLRPVLDQELNRLPEKSRVPVVLCDLEGRTRREVARQLGIPEGTLSGRLTTAHRLLAKRLTRHGLAFSAATLAVALSQSTASACVPAALVVPTVKAAALLASGESAAGVISAKVAGIAEGVLKAMLLTRLKITAAVLLAVEAVVGGSGAFVHSSFADTESDWPAATAELFETPQIEDSQLLAAEEVQAPGEQPNNGTSVAGTLQSIDTARNSVTIARNNRRTGKSEKTYDLANNVAVLRYGNPARLSDLKPGGHITIRLSPDQKTALGISETGKVMLGQFKSVDPANRTITVVVTVGRDPIPKEITHQLASNGKVTLDGKDVDLADLKQITMGLSIQLIFSVDDDKKLVHIQSNFRRRQNP